MKFEIDSYTGPYIKKADNHLYSKKGFKKTVGNYTISFSNLII